MQYQRDKRGSKLVLIFLIIIFSYLAFFGFDVRAAYTYTVDQLQSVLGL